MEGGAGVRSARRACGRAGAPDRLDARQVAAVAARPAICIVPVPGGADTPPSARSETDAPLCGRWFGLGALGGDATQHRGECREGSAGRVLCIPRALAYEGVSAAWGHTVVWRTNTSVQPLGGGIVGGSCTAYRRCTLGTACVGRAIRNATQNVGWRHHPRRSAGTHARRMMREPSGCRGCAWNRGVNGADGVGCDWIHPA